MNPLEKLQVGGESYSIFQSAAKGDLDAVRRHLEEGFDLHAENSTGIHLFGIALSPPSSTDLLKLLIEFGGDVNRPLNRFGEMPLLRAVNSGDINLVRLLVENGAKVSGSETPVLVGAVANGNVAIFDYLFDQGADINEKDTAGRTLMHSGALANQAEMLEQLHALGLDIDIQDTTGRTPLALAAMQGAERSAQWLVKNGANPEICDWARRSPSAWAEASGHQRIVELLSGD